MARKAFGFPRYNKLTITQDSGGLDVETLATAGAIIGKGGKVDLKVKSSESVVYGNNSVAAKIKAFDSGTVALEVDDISDTVEADLLGQTVTTGVTDSKDTDDPPYVRLGYIRQRYLNGVTTHRATVLMKCKFSVPDETDETIGATTNLKPSSMMADVFKNKDGIWRKAQTFATEALALAWINGLLNIT